MARVRVARPRALESFPTVHHLVATVEGELHGGCDNVDLLRATFPGGSITGAPKVRAMQIIDELEPTRRSVYTGAAGYIGFDGDMDLNIVIRTFLVRGGPRVVPGRRRHRRGLAARERIRRDLAQGARADRGRFGRRRIRSGFSLTLVWRVC